MPQAGDESRALESHIRRTDNQRLARGLLEREEVVAGDAVLLCAGYVGVLGPATDGDHKGGCRVCFGIPLGIFALDCVRVHERGFCIYVRDVCASQLCSVPEVERADVILHALHHSGPVMLVLVPNLPPQRRSIT
jgi:hypothetical protein